MGDTSGYCILRDRSLPPRIDKAGPIWGLRLFQSLRKIFESAGAWNLGLRFSM
jgi:hypothetical protein